MHDYLTASVRALFVVSLVLSAVALGTGSVAADQQYTDFEQPELKTTIQGENVVSAGEVRTFTVSVQNRHGGMTDMDRSIDDIAQVVKSQRVDLGAASAVTADVDAEGAPLDVRTGQQTLGTIAAGNERRTSVTVEVDEDAKPGTYRLPVTMTYSYVFGINVDSDGYLVNRNTETVTTYVTVRVEPSARLDVVDTASEDLYENADGTVTVTVRNSGSEVAHDAELVMQESSYLHPKSNGVALGRLAPGETATASYQVGVKNVDSAGTYAGNFQLQYEDENGNPLQSAVRTGDVAIATGPEYDLTAEPTALYVDSTGAVAVTVTNTGERTVENARAALKPLEPFTLVSSTASLGTLDPGESATARFKLEVSDRAIAQQYPLTVTVAHDDAYGNRVESDPKTVDVRVGPESTISVVDTARVTAGSTETVTYTIKNTGDGTLRDAVARINVNSPFETDDDTAYVGTLEPGETTTVSYTVSVESAATPKTYSLDTSVKYDNAFGETVVTDVESAPIEVVAGEGGLLPFSLSGLTIGGVTIPLALAAGIVYRTDALSRFR